MSFSFEGSMKLCEEVQNEIIQSTPELDFAITNSQNKGVPPISIGRAQGQFLSILCRSIGAKKILELGSLGGYSTIWLATSVPGVKVTSIEYEAKHHEVAVENVKSYGNVDIIRGAGLDVLPQLEKDGQTFDFVFIDADWETQGEYYDWAVKMTRPGGMVYVDNAFKQVIDATAEGDPRARELIDRVKSNKKADATLMPILYSNELVVGDSVDGFVLAIVK